MAQLAVDTVYKDLKERGLDLAVPTILVIPQQQPKPSSLLGKLGSMLSRDTSDKNKNNTIVYPVLYSCILVAHRNIIYVYRYIIDSETSEMEVKHIQVLNLAYEVKNIKGCDNNYVRDRSDIPIMINGQGGLGFFIFDFKEFKLIQKQFIKNNHIFEIHMLNQKQAFMITTNGQYHQYSVNHGQLKPRNKGGFKLLLGPKESIVKHWLISDIDEQKKSPIKLFYAVMVPESQKMILKIKQLFRSPEGEIIVQEQSDYVLQTDSLVYRPSFNIIPVKDYYCIQLPAQISIMKKKFNKYMILDSMVQKFIQHKIFLNRKAIVASIGNKTMELSSINLSDPKSTLRICDVINLPTSLQNFAQNFVEAWPIITNKQYTLMFIFKKDNQVYLSNLIKHAPLQKMMILAKDPSTNLEVIRDMALNLGISNKDFYLKLWSTSKKENHDIYKYLIPCSDIPSIKRQLKFLLRRKTVPVSQMLKVLDKMSKIINDHLKSSMNYSNMREYVKNQFVRRKLKLNEMNKMLDHRAFDKIYSSSILSTVTDMIQDQIDPAQIIIDPLHPVPEHSPYKELKSLGDVFQQFKVLLLQNYKDFLIAILQKFPGKTLQILNRYNFLLPNFPFQIEVQKPSKTNQPVLPVINNEKNNQPIWFQDVTVNQWKSQMTKQRIVKQFYDYYPTSKIIETVDDFTNSIYGRENKRGRHGLITLSLDQFTNQVKQFQGIRLYLQICQFANEKAVNQYEDPGLSLKILDILEKKNKLSPPDFDYCVLYAKMHYFMLKNNIIQAEKLNISELTQLKPQSLVALFFLENKQKKQFIFREFMDLYEDKSQFHIVLRKFVQSQNCSKIQLQILMKEVIDMGPQFQRQNQQVIQILLIGQCMKLQIRQNPAILQTQQESKQSNLIDDIQISKGLAFKINKIKQLWKCQKIFDRFNCSKMTYQDLINLEENGEIFKLLLDKYFNNELKSQKIEIQDQIIDLDSPRNMLTVLIYLQQTVYYNVKTFDLLVEYGLILIQWKQFEVIKNLMEQKEAFQALEINAIQYLQNLITRALDTIYLDLEIIYDDQTKEQIINVVSIDPSDSPLKIQQLAKLQLVDIFQSWQCSVHPSDIHTICHQWSQYHRRDFIEDLIAQYIDKLNFQTFQAVYTQLQIIDKKSTQINIHNEEYVQFCIMYAHKLLQKARYKEVIQVLTFIKNLANVPINFGLQSQAFLRSILEIYPEDLNAGRQMIEFFVQNNNQENQYNVKQLFESYFDQSVLSLWQREQKLKVNSSFFYKRATGQCFYKLDDLWELSKKDGKNTKDIYYNYYLIINALKNPNTGLTRIHGISYNYEKITDLLLIHLENFNNSNKEYWIINFDQLLQKFLKGLAGQAMYRLQVSNQTQGTSKLEAILDMLKQNREENNQLIKSLTRVRQQIKSKVKRGERKDRFMNLLEQITQENERKRKLLQQNQQQNLQEQEPEQEVFLTWRKIESQKKNITTKSQFFLSEKDLIDQAFLILGQNVAFQPKKSHPKKPNILTNLFLPTIQDIQSIDLLVDMILKQQFQRVSNYSPKLVAEALKKGLQANPDLDPYPITDLMEKLEIGDMKKIQIFKLTKFFRGSLTNKQLNTLFNSDFLTKPLEVDEDIKYITIYQQLQPRIKQTVKTISREGLKDLAHLLENSLQSSQYSALAFFQALMYLIQNAQFKLQSAITAQQCVRQLGGFPEIVANKYTDLLRADYMDDELKIFVKQNLYRLMQDKGYDQIAQSIECY